MAKTPAFSFYPGDWSRDPQLQMCSASTRGIWINLLCAMWWSPTRGTVTGSLEEMCKLGNCTKQELGIFLEENCHHNFADVTSCHNAVSSNVTVSNRRMVREEKVKESARFRKSRQRSRRESQESHRSVTLALPSTPSTPSPSTPIQDKKVISPEAKPELPEWFITCLKTSPNFCILSDDKHAKFWKAMSTAYDPYEWLKWDEEIQKADAWIAANPQRRPRALTRFLQSWFNRAVEHGRIQHAKEQRARTQTTR